MIKMIKMSGFPNSGWGGWLGDHGASEGRSARRFGHEALDPDRTEASKRRDVSVFSRGRTPAIGGEPPLSVLLARHSRFLPGDGFFSRTQNDRRVLTFRSRQNQTRTASDRRLKVTKMIFGLLPRAPCGFGASTGGRKTTDTSLRFGLGGIGPGRRLAGG